MGVMRLLGILLVIVGALILGFQWYRSADREARVEQGVAADSAPLVHPAVGGIAVVGGLLLLANAARRD